MLIPELIKRAVAGALRFDFIESTITVTHGSTLSSLKGQGHAEPADDGFHYHFLPRGPVLPPWTEYLDPAAQEAGSPSFLAAGVERGSAGWFGTAVGLRYMNNARGPAIHARVREWSHSDERSVHMSFVRTVIPGQLAYPVMIRHAAGLDARVAAAEWGRLKLEVRDYGHYTEICAFSPDVLPESFAQHAVQALSTLLGIRLDWVYRERHADRRRVISVRLPAADAKIDEGGGTTSLAYADFWQAYIDELRGLL